MSETVRDLTEMVKEHRRKVEEKTIGVKEFAEIMGVGESTAREMIRSKNPPPYIKVGNRYRIIISRIDEWLNKLIGQEF